MLEKLVRSGTYDSEKEVIIQAIKNLHERTKARENGSKGEMSESLSTDLKQIYGFDFVQSSVDIVNEISKFYNFNSEGKIFDIINPDFKIHLDENSLIFTAGVIEQIAGKFDKFIDYILQMKPKLVVNSEPIYELYDQDNLFDYLAAKFHYKRGYTRGYLTRLLELEKEGKIEIIKLKRLNFGSLLMEGYTCIVWKPL